MPKAALPPLDQVDPVDAWKSWEPGGAQAFDLKWAGHLYRRAVFGAALDELNAAVKRGLPATLDRLFQGSKREDNNFEETRHLTGQAVKGTAFDLRGWWVYWMLKGSHPLKEKLTLFWHNHFATSIVKVQKLPLMFAQNELLYRHALGKFGPLLLEISRDPAMLIWLDGNSNVKGKANENYAREVMELFSLGLGHYKEHDIREAARAFTGWHTDGAAFTFKPELHDDGVKTILGSVGNWNGDDVVKILLEQRAAPRFLVRKLYRFYVSENITPPDAFLQPLADAYKKSDYDTGSLLRTMLQSRHFFSAYAYRQRVKSPVEFCVGAANEVGANLVAPRAIIGRLEAMGQPLFAPPNVKGWEHGKSWLNTSTVLARHNFAAALFTAGNADDPDEDDIRRLKQTAVKTPPLADAADLARKAKATDPKDIAALLLDTFMQGDVSPATRDRLVNYLAEDKPKDSALDVRIRETAHAIMTMPEYELA